jgi:glycosyltransferase involved in cell wall biosynthesis
MKHRYVSALINGQRLLDPNDLLSPNRIDIAAKTIFARAYLEGNVSKWPNYVYKEHIRAFNNFFEEEPVKKKYEDFSESFINTIESYKRSNSWKHLAPIIHKHGHLINGAHRVAAAMVLEDRVNAVQRLDTDRHNWDYRYFKTEKPEISKIDDNVLDYMTIEYVSLKKKNVFAAIIFPTAEGLRKEAYTHLASLGEIVNMKSFRHDEFVGKEVIKQLYFDSNNDAWNYGLSFDNATNKARECFDGTGSLQVFIIEANLDESSRIKEKQYLRSLWNRDKHSIHITDTHDEVNRVVRMFFNENSRRFLKINRKQEFSSQKMYDMFNEYISLMPKNVNEREKIAIEGSAVFDLLNIRPGRDIDYITRSDDINFTNDNIEKHNEFENKFHSLHKDEILTNPKYYFYYKGLKFVDILELQNFKKNRSYDGNLKDINDLRLIENFVKNNPQYLNASNHETDPQPVVSIIIPVYNVEKYLTECIDSVISQTYNNLEIVLVDDGSTDLSSDLCDKLALNDCRIKVIHKDNEGLNMARKTGYENSSGTWILFVDSDDILRQQAVEIIYDSVKKHGVDLAIGGYRRFETNKNTVDHSIILYPEMILEKNKQKYIHQLVTRSGYENVLMETAWMKLFSRKIIDAVDWDYSNYRANEDEFMAIQYYPILTNGVVIVPEDLYYYRQNDNSITRSKFYNSFEGKNISKFKTIEDLYRKSLSRLDKKFEDEILLKFTNQFLGYLEEYLVLGYLDDTLIEEYELYFKTKISKIERITDLLDDSSKEKFNILKNRGVFGFVHYVIVQKNNHIHNLENINNQYRNELKNTEKLGIKTASRKLAGAIKRKIYKIIK